MAKAKRFEVRRVASGSRTSPQTSGSRRYTPEQILNAIRRCTELYGSPPPGGDWEPSRARRRGQLERARRFEAGDWPSTRVVRRAFGTFNAAVLAAGYEPRPAPTRIRSALVDRTEILRAIQAWTSRYGDPPTMADWDTYRARRLGQTWRISRYSAGDWPSLRTVCAHFGNLSNAIRAAGLDPRPAGGEPAATRLARQANRQILKHERTLDAAAIAPQLLAGRLSAVARARKDNDLTVLRGSLIQLASAALNWADHLEDAEGAASGDG